MNEKLNKILSGIKNIFRSNTIKPLNIDENQQYLGIDLAAGEDFTVINNQIYNNSRRIEKKNMSEVDRLFEIMRRVKKYRVKRKLAKRIKKVYSNKK